MSALALAAGYSSDRYLRAEEGGMRKAPDKR